MILGVWHTGGGGHGVWQLTGAGRGGGGAGHLDTCFLYPKQADSGVTWCGGTIEHDWVGCV
jgi:hypothetical protein